MFVWLKVCVGGLKGVYIVRSGEEVCNGRGLGGACSIGGFRDTVYS